MRMKNIIKTLLPNCLYVYIQRLRNKKNARIAYGDQPKSYCPICRNKAYFLSAGISNRAKSQCPYCGSRERHRLLWIFLQNTDIFNKKEKKMLHIAAESCFEKIFKKTFRGEYITADLYNPNAMIKMDITNIQYPNETFDIIICSNVLEHVDDDIKAMNEIWRVLKDNGWAILLVPIADMEKTYEDSSIKNDEKRLKAFGHKNHIRKYGKDFVDRLKFAGFNIKITQADELVDDEGIKKMCLKEGKDGQEWGFLDTEIFFCEKK